MKNKAKINMNDSETIILPGAFDNSIGKTVPLKFPDGSVSTCVISGVDDGGNVMIEFDTNDITR